MVLGIFSEIPHQVQGHVACRPGITLGVLGAAFVGLLLLASAIVYVVPIGKSTYWADMSETGQIKVGDDVRSQESRSVP